MSRDTKSKAPPWDAPPCPKCGSTNTEYYPVPFVSLEIYARCTDCQFVWACGPFTSTSR